MSLIWKAEKLLTRKEACELLECSIGTFIKYIHDLGISEVDTLADGYPGGKAYMYRYDDVQKIMNAIGAKRVGKTTVATIVKVENPEPKHEDDWVKKLADIRAMLGIDCLEQQRVQLLNEILDAVIDAGNKCARLKELL